MVQGPVAGTFSRTGDVVVPQFVPGEDYKAQPIGNADDQVVEAMRIAKELNNKPETGLAERIAKMDAMTVATATDFLDGLSPHERERYIQAEKLSKDRKSITGRYGRS